MKELSKLEPELLRLVDEVSTELLEPETVEEVKEMLITTSDGSKIKQCRENCMIALKNDPLLRGAFKKNLLSCATDIVKDMGWHRMVPAMDDTDMRYIYHRLETEYDLGCENKIADSVDMIANDNAYHPIIDVLEKLEWDGKERIREALKHFLGASNDDYTYEAMKTCMLGAICRVFDPGVKFDYMLCLVGGQGGGKSTFLRFLAINDDWYSDDIKKLDDEKIRIKLQGKWIIEMSEMLAVANAKSIEDIKSFISRKCDTYKIPYDRRGKDYPRQCVFFGSSNNIDFLPLDRTGNRRFLPVMTNPCNAEVHILDNENESRAYITQMWAEAMTIYREGNFCLALSKQMMAFAEKVQKDFMPEDAEAGQIIAYLETCKENVVCSMLLYEKALNRDVNHYKKYELRDIGTIMNSYVKGWIKFDNPRYFPTYGRQRGWERVRDTDNKADNKADNNADNNADSVADFRALGEEEQLRLPFDT